MLCVSNFNHFRVEHYHVCSFYTSETTSAVMCQDNFIIVIFFTHVYYRADNKIVVLFILFLAVGILVSLENTFFNISLFSATHVKVISPSTDILSK